MADVLFQVRDLTKSYESGAGLVHALRGVTIDIVQGEILVLLGPSGSGKSTLLNILGGLDRATSGSVVVGGVELTDASDHDLTEFRRRSVGFVFQFFNLASSLTARENVELITEIADAPMDAGEALALVGLTGRADHFPAQLSGGEQQRVAVARAIAKRPQILFCDEPTGSLDSQSGVKVLEAITTVVRQTGTTAMIVTHNVGIGAIADRVVRFSDGRISQVTVNTAIRPPSELSW